MNGTTSEISPKSPEHSLNQSMQKRTLKQDKKKEKERDGKGDEEMNNECYMGSREEM